MLLQWFLLLDLLFSVIKPEPFPALILLYTCLSAEAAVWLHLCQRLCVGSRGHAQKALPSGAHRDRSEQGTQPTNSRAGVPARGNVPQGKGGNHSACEVLGCHLHAEGQPQGTEFSSVKNRKGAEC